MEKIIDVDSALITTFLNLISCLEKKRSHRVFIDVYILIFYIRIKRAIFCAPPF